MKCRSNIIIIRAYYPVCVCEGYLSDPFQETFTFSGIQIYLERNRENPGR